MSTSRRKLLGMLGTGVMVTTAGCSAVSILDTSEYVPVRLVNEDDVRHMMVAAVTSTVDGGSGASLYFDESWQLEPGEEKVYPEALSLLDYQPELLALVLLEDETASSSTFDLEYDLEELRITITESGEIDVQART